MVGAPRSDGDKLKWLMTEGVPGAFPFTAGTFPLWLAPVQAVVIPIADRHTGYAEKIRTALTAHKLRVEIDDSNNRMNAKIREAQLQKVPYMLVVGDREADGLTVAVRTRSGDDLGAISLDSLIVRLTTERDSRALQGVGLPEA